MSHEPNYIPIIENYAKWLCSLGSGRGRGRCYGVQKQFNGPVKILSPLKYFSLEWIADGLKQLGIVLLELNRFGDSISLRTPANRPRILEILGETQNDFWRYFAELSQLFSCSHKHTQTVCIELTAQRWWIRISAQFVAHDVTPLLRFNYLPLLRYRSTPSPTRFLKHGALVSNKQRYKIMSLTLSKRKLARSRRSRGSENWDICWIPSAHVRPHVSLILLVTESSNISQWLGCLACWLLNVEKFGRVDIILVLKADDRV
jgi:hypothetical protein